MCTNKEAIANAAASVEMEGFTITEQDREWCEKLLNREITFDEYVAYALEQNMWEEYLKTNNND